MSILLPEPSSDARGRSVPRPRRRIEPVPVETPSDRSFQRMVGASQLLAVLLALVVAGSMISQAISMSRAPGL